MGVQEPKKGGRTLKNTVFSAYAGMLMEFSRFSVSKTKDSMRFDPSYT